MAKKPKKVAVVHCNGGNRARQYTEVDYTGLDCVSLLEKYPEGNSECQHGCLGLGTCVAACKFGAITINAYGVAEVNEKCIGCGLCARKCPRGVIDMRLPENVILVRCSTAQPAKIVRKQCDVSCIGCGRCEKVCPADAIHVIDNHAVIDQEKCMACGQCLVNCPRGCITDFAGIF